MPLRLNTPPTIGLYVALILLAGCSNGPSFASRSPEVRIEADNSANFSSYHTYVLLPGQLSADPKRVKLTSDELDQRMAAALAPRVAGKGLRPAKGQEAVDLYISYTAVVRRNAEIVHAGGRPGGYDEPGAIAPGAEWGVRESDQGTLALQFTDARSRAGVWRAIVTADVAEKSGVLNRALDAALKNYPPKK